VKKKLDRPAPAQDLYTSSLFRKERSHAEATGTPWSVLSTEHGLVTPATVLEPYDLRLSKTPSDYRRAWGARVVEQLKETIGTLAGKVSEVHSGSAHADAIRDRLRAEGAEVIEPLHGLTMGERLAWLAGLVLHRPRRHALLPYQFQRLWRRWSSSSEATRARSRPPTSLPLATGYNSPGSTTGGLTGKVGHPHGWLRPHDRARTHLRRACRSDEVTQRTKVEEHPVGSHSGYAPWRSPRILHLPPQPLIDPRERPQRGRDRRGASNTPAVALRAFEEY
jgi:hypothetical protein